MNDIKPGDYKSLESPDVIRSWIANHMEYGAFLAKCPIDDGEAFALEVKQIAEQLTRLANDLICSIGERKANDRKKLHERLDAAFSRHMELKRNGIVD